MVAPRIGLMANPQVGTGFVPGQPIPQRGLQYQPASPWRSAAAGGLQGLGAMLMALATGQGQQAPAAFQAALQGQQEAEARRRAQAREDELYQFRLEELADKRTEREEKKANEAAAEAKFGEFSARLTDDDPANDPTGIRDLLPFLPYEQQIQLAPELFPEPEGPQSGIGKIMADLNAGLIDQATADALIRKETYIAPQQGPGMTERERNARAAGLQPGTPEYAQYILGRDDTAPGPFQGTSMDAQSYNMVLAGDPSTPEYAAAYAQLAMPKVTFDPVTQKMVMVAPDMSWARKPVTQGGQSGAVPPLRPGPTVENAQPLGRAQSAPFDVMQVPGATITSSAGGVKMSPEEATKFTALQEGAKDIQSAIETLAPGGNVSEFGVASGQSVMGIEGIPFTAGRQSRQQMQRGIEAILRAMTGAAAPESEVQRYMGMFFPSPTDSDASAKEKLNAAKAWVDGITNLMKTGRPQLQGGETTAPGGGTFVPQLPQGDWQ